MVSAAKLELSQRYLSNIRALSSNPNMSDDYRCGAMRATLESNGWRKLSAPTRAKVIHDFAGVLAKQWKESEADGWVATKASLDDLLGSLDAIASKLPNTRSAETLIFVDRLRDEINNTELFESYEAFWQKNEGKPFDTHEEFDLWFHQCCPYLIMGLSADLAIAEKELEGRVEKVLARLPDGIGLNEFYDKLAWQYAYDAYNPGSGQRRTN